MRYAVILCALLLLFVPFALPQTTLPVTFEWDASTTPSPAENPVKYRLCTTITGPSGWPSGQLPANRVCQDAVTALQYMLQMDVGVKFVFATARNCGVAVDGSIGTCVEQESGASNVLRVEVFAPPGRPDKIRLKSVSQAQSTSSGQKIGYKSTE